MHYLCTQLDKQNRSRWICVSFFFFFKFSDYFVLPLIGFLLKHVQAVRPTSWSWSMFHLAAWKSISPGTRRSPASILCSTTPCRSARWGLSSFSRELTAVSSWCRCPHSSRSPASQSWEEPTCTKLAFWTCYFFILTLSTSVTCVSNLPYVTM